MGLLQSYSAFLVKHPGKVLIVSTGSVLVLFCLTIYFRPMQSFNDPLVGFEARGTEIGAKINTWRLLSDETSASANNLSLLPNWSRYDGSYQHPTWSRPGFETYRNEDYLNTTMDPEPPIVESSIQQTSKITNATTEPPGYVDEDEEEYYTMVNATRDIQPPLVHYSLGSSKAFCGRIYEGYAQAIVAPSQAYSSQGMFNLNSLLAVCQLDRRLRMEHSPQEGYLFLRDCEQYRYEDGEQDRNITTTCCNSWSLPNYIACINNKPSCMNLDINDMKMTENLLNLCAPHYYDSPYEECFTPQPEGAQTTLSPHINFMNQAPSNLKSHCGQIPDECLKCGGWIYTVLHYLTNDNFIRQRATPSNIVDSSNRIRQSNRVVILPARETSVHKLTYTNIFLPMAKSSSLLGYYLALSKHSLKTPYAQVKVLNLGLKNSLFEHLISVDVRLFLIALIAILVVISLYTWSLLISFVILLIICLSLCLSYTIYELILNIAIFPFMNLLAIVISFGICSDNAMLFCKHWGSSEDQSIEQAKSRTGDLGLQNVETQTRDLTNLDRMLKKAVMSTSVATLATACSFVISAISQVTAVRCFCIFATLSVITNYLLIILLLPPALIIDRKLQSFLFESIDKKGGRLAKLNCYAHRFRGYILELGDLFYMKWLFMIITNFKFYLIITFIALLLCSSILVFREPGLQPADDEDIQLLSKKHAFEQYDKSLKQQFAFERAKQGELVATKIRFPQEDPETLPIRVIFGLKPQDNGDHFDPHSRGTLSFDQNFDIADANSQIWLLNFCQKLRNQRFVHQPRVTDMSNCFMETFKSWMETRTCQDPIHTNIDRSPCCQTYDFPYDRYTFNKCMLEAVSIMRRSPHLYPNVNAGLRFFKNSTKVAALIVEFLSNRVNNESFTEMESFYNDMDEWVSWHINNTAPQSLKSGWFTSSNLDLFALRAELEQSTNSSILLEIVFATIALMISTRNIFLTIAGTLTVGTIIIIILANLILLRWTLGVAESILVSLTIGLSIDFALHYTVAYSEGLKSRLSHGVIQRILNEVGSPVALATTTTSLAGFIIVWSDILAYQELGAFLMLIAVVSWLSSTFFLLPMLATFDSIKEFNEQYSRMIVFRARKILIERLGGIS